MKNSKAISLLKSFSASELKEFRLFIRSPFFNREKVHEKLFMLLKKYHPAYPEDKIQKEKIYLKLFPGRKYNDGAMRNVISDFQRLEMEFLRLKGMGENVYLKEHFLMDELMKRNKPVLFNKIQRKAVDALNGSFKDHSFFHNSYLLNGLEENLAVKTHDRFLIRKFDKSLMENFLPYMILQLLYLNSKILNSNKMINEVENIPILDGEITGFLETAGNKYMELTYVNCYYLMYKMFKTGDDKYFFELKDALIHRFMEIENTILRNLFTSLENYAVEKIDSGNHEFYNELFLIYRFMVEKKLYTGSFGHMRHIFYLNIVSIGLEAGQMEWVENFIKLYKDEVYVEFRNEAYQLAEAIICYWKREYDNSITLVSKIRSDDFAFKINVRSLYLKIYFDLNETESFYSHIDALRHYYNKSRQVPASLRNMLSDYVNYSKKLFDLKNGINDVEFDLVNLKKTIQASTSLINKTWLLKKASELEKK